MSDRTIEIVGAGPAGLSAALSARASGAEVIVYEKRSDVGARFHGDFQGLENWSSDTGVLSELAQCGVQATFALTPVQEFVCFDPRGRAQTVRADEPIFYLVRRGSEPGTLDAALKKQVLDAGIEIRFGSHKRHIRDGGVVAEGPHRADAIAAGYVFETDMADGCYAAVGTRLARDGYSYLLVDQGRGTVASCLFSGFHDERRYVENTLEFFKRAAGLRWDRARRFGGSGNFDHVQSAVIGNRLYVGEAAGFQDALFGFGLRYAILSGYLAGRSDGTADAYERAWRSRLGGLNASSLFNRRLYRWLGDPGRQAVINHVIPGRDARLLLQRIYAPARWKAAAARWLPGKPLLRVEHARSGCNCTWCRCQHGHRASAEAPS
ncbi:MAG: NAD(P)/FAD-dependent oxidoreductase [Woeseia sp.]